MPSSFKSLSWSKVGCVNIPVSSSMEVSRATDVVVNDRRAVRGTFPASAFKVVLQDGFNRAQRAGIDLQGSFAGCFHPVFSVGFDQSQNAHAGAEPLLGVFPVPLNDLDQCCTVRAYSGGLPRDPARCPIRILRWCEGMWSLQVVC